MGESSEWLQGWAERDPQRAAEILFALVAVGFSGPLLGLSVWIGRFAGKIRRAGRYPPPEAKLARDTRVRTGASALAFVRLHRILAAITALLAIGAPVVLWRVYRQLFGA